jgi:membrane protein
MAREPAAEKNHLKRLVDFVWADHMERSWLARWLLGEIRVFYFVVRGFNEHQCSLQASALTFVTLLSIVPLLALGFVMMNYLGVLPKEPIAAQVQPAPFAPPGRKDFTTQTAVGQTSPIIPPASNGADASSTESVAEKRFVNLLLDSLTDQLTANQVEVRDRIVAYVRNTKLTALTAAGVVVLIVTVISALGTMEHVFNQIWGLRRSRSILRKVTDYMSVVIICPLLLMAAMAMTPMISRNALVSRLFHASYINDALTWSLKLVPYLSTWLALTLLYWFLPNTRVKLRCALAGGFAAGVIWQFAFWGYTKFQAGMLHYNIVYSTLAALPFFLSWLYVSWLIVLFGAEVAAAYQNIETYSRARIAHKICPAERLRIGLNLLLTICARFRREEPPWTADQLSRYLECPARLVDELLADLTTANIVMPSGTGRLPTYVPAVPLNNISPARVVEALQETEAGGLVGTATPEAICARTLMEQWREGLWRELGNVGFDVLVEELHPAAAPVVCEKPR